MAREVAIPAQGFFSSGYATILHGIPASLHLHWFTETDLEDVELNQMNSSSFQDESTDDQFYVQPRLVYHIDDAAVEALTKYYKTVFTEGASVLDIASSW